MDLNVLLERLKGIGVTVIEQQSEDGGKTLTLECALPFPFQRRHAWYPLILAEGQTDVPEYEVRAILRHLWHLSEEPDFIPDNSDDDGEGEQTAS